MNEKQGSPTSDPDLEPERQRYLMAASSSVPLTWVRSKRLLADLAIYVWLRDGIMNAYSWQDAVKLFVARYVDKNGEPIKVKSVFDNLRAREKEGKARFIFGPPPRG